MSSPGGLAARCSKPNAVDGGIDANSDGDGQHSPGRGVRQVALLDAIG
jgi:hypothetical protein